MMYENSPKEINLKSPEICEYGDIYARLIARNIFTEEDEKCQNDRLCSMISV